MKYNLLSYAVRVLFLNDIQVNADMSQNTSAIYLIIHLLFYLFI